MDIKLSTESFSTSPADTYVIFVTSDDVTAPDLETLMPGMLTSLVEAGDFKGNANQIVVLYPSSQSSARRIILAGVGEFSADGQRKAAAVALKRARELSAGSIAVALPTNAETAAAVQATVEGGLMGLYRYRGQKTGDDTVQELQSVTLHVGDNETQAETARTIGQALATGTITARDLVNLPPNICTPVYMAERAEAISQAFNLRFDALGRQQMQSLRMGALLAVAQGSEAPPRFIILEHNAEKANQLPTVVLVGKGVTFDTGGYSIKSGEGMVGMKADMSGAAAVIGAMQAIAMLDVPLHVVGLAPAADNMISGNAYRPQEVITASNGTTIEVISTDAEGRLLLADALVYAKRYEPSAVVDIATLTGSCVVALGKAAAGVFSIDDAVRDILLSAGESTAENVWPMPLFPEYTKALESDTADTKNTGGRMNGVGTSAAFLRQFVDYPAWAHIDMAGMMASEGTNPTIPKGGSGYGARLLTEFVRQWATKQQGQ